MVQWVYEASLQASLPKRVLVATPDSEIVAAVKSFGGEAILTSAGHTTGTDRIAEVAEKMDHHPDVDIRYTKVTCTLSTHSAGGITAKDFRLAEEIDNRVIS